MIYQLLKSGQQFVIITILLALPVNAILCPVHAKQVAIPFHADFGAKNSGVKAGAVLVTEETHYTKKQGFGLLGNGEKSFQLTDRSLKDEMSGDGIASDDAIEFRADLPAGNYWIELFMAGGKKSLWQGIIAANDQVLADSIFQYGVSFEDEDPPTYWSQLLPVTNESDRLILRIKANGQATTVCGISIYADNVGPLQLIDGQYKANPKLKAPNANLALNLLNGGHIEEAQRYIDQIPEAKFRYDKALLLMALSGRLEIKDPRVYMDLAIKLLTEEYQENKRSDVALNLRLATLYSEADMYYKMGGWDWARLHTGAGIFDRLNIAGHKFNKLFQIKNHVLNHRAAFSLGRLSFWAWVEQHDRWQKIRADQCFEYVQPYYPDHRLLQIYRGQQYLAEDVDHYKQPENVPEWVNQTNLALKNLRDVIHYWVDFRQADNGEFGGKYDDDVEMLRWWPIARLALNDSKTLTGMQRLVDGVWHSGWITNGFSTKVRDVEHSSEPVADTQPMMIGLDYGNPIYVEHCMESIKGLRDVWTGINSRGHRHFKSSWYSYDRVDIRPPRDCDLEMNTRTVKAARWLAWYNRHPFAMQFMTEWCDSWLEDCRRTDKGKPYGIVPAAIRYEDDAIGGHADNWHHPGMFWSYYNFNGGTKMLRQFLAMYQLTGQEKYLEPIEEALKLVDRYFEQDVSSAEVGSEAWVAHILKSSSNFAETIELWRLMTGNDTYDHLLSQIGSLYLKYRMTGDKRYLRDGSKSVSDGILYNRELITTEGYFTDRIEIGNINKSSVLGANHLESMYTGSSLHEGFHPYFAVSWDGFNDDFVALVMHADRKKVQAAVCNLDEKTVTGSVLFWQLEAGEYEMQAGPDKNDDGIMESVDTRTKFTVNGRRTAVELTLIPMVPHVIQVRQITSRNKAQHLALADLAVTESDVNVKSDGGTRFELTVPVHNIGIADARNITIRIFTQPDDAIQLLDEQVISKLEAPLDLEPRIENVTFSVDKKRIQDSHIVVAVDADNQIPEITEINNRIEYPFNKRW